MHIIHSAHCNQCHKAGIGGPTGANLKNELRDKGAGSLKVIAAVGRR